MTTRKLYQVLASKTQAWLRCVNSDTITEWEDRHHDDIEAMVQEYMPSGSGVDAGTKFDFDKSTGERLVFNTAYHHMNENGYYDGWTEHVVTVRPSLVNGIVLTISGRNRNDIKDYLSDIFDAALSSDIEA